MNLNPDFKEFIASLNESEVQQVIQLGYPPNRIDLLTTIDGVAFEECFSNRMTVKVDGVDVAFIDLVGLKANKAASGRLQDLADLEELDR